MRHGSDVQESRGLLSFEVTTASGQVLAFLSRASCQAVAGPVDMPFDLARFLARHRLALDRIVMAKLLSGARHPVVLMAGDLVAHAIHATAGPEPGARATPAWVAS